GNFPESFLLEGRREGGTEDAWQVVMPRTKLGPDAVHAFNVDSGMAGLAGGLRDLKLTIFPDGGVSRLRVWGHALC
ncbi:MAG: hypothetical protein SGCHY_004842, partial [Lobulomycetales sp.]